MLVKTYASAAFGISATTIRIEVNVSSGIGYFLVGLPDVAVKESQQRIASALESVDRKWPGKKVVINMAIQAQKEVIDHLEGRSLLE